VLIKSFYRADSLESAETFLKYDISRPPSADDDISNIIISWWRR